MANKKANPPAYSYVGKSAPRIEGEKKVCGQALYTADHVLPGTVWGKVLRSPYPHARIMRVNSERAKAHAGVLAVLTAADIPEVLTGRRLRDMPMLAGDRVRFVGEKVAVVAAAERDVAEEAAQLIDVEYKPLTPVFDPLAAISEGAPELHERLAEYQGLPRIDTPPKNTYSHEEWLLGDVERGFREADQIFEDGFATQHVHQTYLEPHSSVVSIDRDTGIIHVWVSNKVPYNTKNSLADAIGVPAQKIVIHVSTIGGDFGGKGALMDLPLCCFLAQRLNRPVRMVMTYTEELTAANPRHAAQIVVKTGLKKDGRITARQIKVYWNGGAYGAMKPIPTVNLPGAVKAAGAYAIPNVRIDSYAIYTNSVPCGHFRSPGLVQLAFAGESQIDMIAAAMKIDPLELRLRNALTDGFPTPDVKGMVDVKCKEVLETAAKTTHWKKKNLPAQVGRGMALSYRHVGLGDANARLQLNSDGKISILTTYADTGTGAHTILCQMVAEVLDVPLSQVGLEVGTTDAFRSESGTGASRVTFVLGQAVLKAAAQLKSLTCARAAEILGASSDKITLKKGRLSIAQAGGRSLTLAELAKAAAEKNLRFETESYHAEQEIPPEGVFAACVAEVSVDAPTGQVTLRKLDTIHDVATILNPVGHQGQIDGGIMQGVGYGLMEELLMEEGRVTTANLGEYKIPNIQDIPPLKTTLVHSHEGASPFQSKEIGESAISQVAPAIANAIYDAVGVRIKDLPITAEKVYGALKELKDVHSSGFKVKR
ncbi:MAG TPA: xanthine dehydrogenase family protein molybdopterin-binding subunit [Candidatus Binatia bacterium]|nr:xanthine dehydrogenase family protein molybdopterin-binding subunit [Candidatus Binatia bacterium]